ncbi:MAG TPA: metallophosphoesterase, partial [Rhabdochlamydiaceae bacterium]|nr:metallophosphoesterase [Rhabdochlamydiaceae bacterium]
MIKIAHISDLHFSNWDWNPSQFFSKRWLGNLNFLFGRQRHFAHERLKSLPTLFRNHGISHVMITGDLTTTSSLGEFEKAREFVEALEAVGLKVFVIPGNHDQYTKRAHKDQLFYNYFPSQWAQYDLIKDGL